jgi:hypothetical protein
LASLMTSSFMSVGTHSKDAIKESLAAAKAFFVLVMYSRWVRSAFVTSSSRANHVSFLDFFLADADKAGSASACQMPGIANECKTSISSPGWRLASDFLQHPQGTQSDAKVAPDIAK